jgi:hypothetical protein
MKPSQVNGKDLNGMPESRGFIGSEKMNNKEHLWVATVVFDISDEVLASGEIILAMEHIHAQNIQCLVCSMPWRKGREGRICSGVGSG